MTTTPSTTPPTTAVSSAAVTPHPSWLSSASASDSVKAEAYRRAIAATQSDPVSSSVTAIATTTSSRNRRKKQKASDAAPKIQVDMTQVDSEWPERIEQLQLYKQDNGTCEVVESRHPALYHWTLQVQRILQEDIEDALLKPAQAQQLIDLGFGGNQTKWELMFAKLKAYYEEHGDCKVPVRYTVDKKLGKWVSRQRDGHNARFLTEERRERLNAIGFSWKISSKRETLVGDDTLPLPAPAPPKSPKAWGKGTVLYHAPGSASMGNRNNSVSRSNSNSKTTKSSLEQTRKDEEQVEWEYQFQKLKAFQKKHGHTCLPRPYTQDPGLGLWVQTQCSLLHVNNLRAERKKRLKSIDFDFWQHLRTKKKTAKQQKQKKKTGPITPKQTPAQQIEEEWNVQFIKLVHFKAKHGHTHVRKEEDEVLWGWVRDQRSLHSMKHLPHEYEIKLAEIGFDFSNLEEEQQQEGKAKDENRKNAVMAAAAAISQTDDVVAEAVAAAESRMKLPPLGGQQQQQQQQQPSGLHALAAAMTLGNMNAIGGTTTTTTPTTLGKMTSHYNSQGNYVRNPVLLSYYNNTQNQAFSSMVTAAATPQYTLPPQMRQVTPPLNMAVLGGMTGLSNTLQIPTSAAGSGSGFAAANNINNNNASPPSTSTPDQIGKGLMEGDDSSRLNENDTVDDVLQKMPSGDSDDVTAAELSTMEDGGVSKRRQLEEALENHSPLSTMQPKKTMISPGSAAANSTTASQILKKRKLVDDEEGRSFAAACYALANKLKRPRTQQ